MTLSSTPMPFPHPHEGGFSTVVVTNASRTAQNLQGVYICTERLVAGKPIYKKDIITHFEVTHLWCSPAHDEKWVFGRDVWIEDNSTCVYPDKCYAVAEQITPMPHFTQTYKIQGHKGKIFSYSIKAPPIEATAPIDLTNQESEASDESEESERDEAASGFRPTRATKRRRSPSTGETKSRGAAPPVR